LLAVPMQNESGTVPLTKFLTIKKMRKVSKVITAAFYSNEAKTVSNTTTNGKAIFLHGNKIAEKRDGKIWITSAGWISVN